ncbi:hypothetical protein K438DRAFT_2118350 [Mycena galopus ATCC 62051]|nr:hypothetical protein K438DRAFT_2118350 [Mycena galopus ATCC 62051]
MLRMQDLGSCDATVTRSPCPLPVPSPPSQAVTQDAALPPLNATPPLDESEASSSEEDTKKSFDWTGELRNFSVASVSSYGHVTNPGVNDPFEYRLPMPSLRERPSSEDLSVTMSLNRIRVASDASSFYFKAPTQPSGRGHSRRKSNPSFSSQNPPISFYNYNRSFGNPALSENDTSTSGSSLAHQYATYGANGGLKAWAKHRQQSLVDSVMSDYSVGKLGRPGVGDKMFGTAMDHRQPLRAISASPPESRGELRNRSSYDSIIDEERRSSSMEDSLFEKTGHRSSDSVFGYDHHHPPNGHLLPPHQFRPLSVLSFNNSVHSPMKDDDTISMLGGGDHIRRRSIGSVFEASPCIRVEKRKHTAFQDDDKGPIKAHVVTKPSIASTSSSQFGGERMIRARQGLLVRQSLEESCLIAEGEDLTSQGSSMSDNDGSQSSIDMSEINGLLSNTTHPMSTMTSRTRPRASTPLFCCSHTRLAVVGIRGDPGGAGEPGDCVFIVDPDAGSVDMSADGAGWDDERGIVALRRYYVLRHEAEDTVTESERTWSDTPFSVYALRAFQPPKNPEDMQALLQHSVQNYGPLPSELGPRRAIEVNANVDMSPTVLSPKRENAWGLAPNARPRVASAARCSALGWAKRSSTKENQN